MGAYERCIIATISGYPPWLSGSNSLHPHSYLILLESLASYFSIYIILSLSLSADKVRTRCCLGRSAFTEKALSSRLNPIWLVTTDPWFQLQSLHEPTRETRTVKQSWKDGIDVSEQFTLIFYVCPPLLGLLYALVLSSVIYSCFLIHFHPFPSFSSFGLCCCAGPSYRSQTNTSVGLSVM